MSKPYSAKIDRQKDSCFFIIKGVSVQFAGFTAVVLFGRVDLKRATFALRLDVDSRRDSRLDLARISRECNYPGAFSPFFSRLLVDS